MSGLPRYRCHKVVQAAKIVDVTTLAHMPDSGGILALDGAHPVAVDASYLAKHQPSVGGYFVVYDDGYLSFSPAKAFEDGYTRLEA